MIVQLKIDGGKLTFDPPFRELRDILLRLLTDIVQNASGLPRVSTLWALSLHLCPGLKALANICYICDFS